MRMRALAEAEAGAEAEAKAGSLSATRCWQCRKFFACIFRFNDAFTIPSTSIPTPPSTAPAAATSHPLSSEMLRRGTVPGQAATT